MSLFFIVIYFLGTSLKTILSISQWSSLSQVPLLLGENQRLAKGKAKSRSCSINLIYFFKKVLFQIFKRGLWKIYRLPLDIIRRLHASFYNHNYDNVVQIVTSAIGTVALITNSFSFLFQRKIILSSNYFNVFEFCLTKL